MKMVQMERNFSTRSFNVSLYWDCRSWNNRRCRTISISIGGRVLHCGLCSRYFGYDIKFAEVSLSLKYRKFLPDGTVAGGPMHFIAHGLTRRKMRWLGQPLAVIFAYLCIGGGLTGGNMIQINQTTRQIINITGEMRNFFTDITGL